MSEVFVGPYGRVLPAPPYTSPTQWDVSALNPFPPDKDTARSSVRPLPFRMGSHPHLSGLGSHTQGRSSQRIYQTSNQNRPADRLPSMSELLAPNFSAEPAASTVTPSPRAGSPQSEGDRKVSIGKHLAPNPHYDHDYRAVSRPRLNSNLSHQPVPSPASHSSTFHPAAAKVASNGARDSVSLPPIPQGCFDATTVADLQSRVPRQWPSSMPDSCSPTAVSYENTSFSPNGGALDVGLRPRLLHEEYMLSEGVCYVYEGGTRIPKPIAGEQINPQWGVTKAGRPRKRLAQACTTCREKKIKCDPSPPKCLQCQKFGRECRFESSARSSRQEHNARPTPTSPASAGNGSEISGSFDDPSPSRSTTRQSDARPRMGPTSTSPKGMEHLLSPSFKRR